MKNCFVKICQGFGKNYRSSDKNLLHIQLNCPLLKGNQANHPKFKRPNGKNAKSKIVLKSVKNRQPEISLFTFLHGQNSSSPWTAISAILDP